MMGEIGESIEKWSADHIFKVNSVAQILGKNGQTLSVWRLGIKRGGSLVRRLTHSNRLDRLLQKGGVAMLVLSRKVGESFVIGNDIIVTVVRISASGVRLGIEAPSGCSIARAELADLLKAQFETNRDLPRPEDSGDDKT